MTPLGFICPFRGVHPFTKEDNTFFAGRESEIQQVISKLYSSKLTIFYGESGCGKTSLIRAGLIPAMETPDHRVAVVLFRDWQSADFEETLRRGVLKSLLLVINRLRTASKEFSESHEDGSPAFEEDLAELEEWFCKALAPELSASILTSEQLYREVALDRFLIECCAVFEGRIFFVFDQFEEYLYYHPDGSTGSSFDTALARAINDPEVPASFMFSLRDDGLGKLDRLRPRIPSLLTNVFRLEHLSIDGANAAMTIPLQKYLGLTKIEVQIEPALQAKLIDQVREDRIGFEDVYLPPRDNEPLAANLRYRALFLQIILTRLWEKDISPGKNGTIRLETFEGYSAPGSKRQSEETEARYIVRTYFDDLLSTMGEKEQDLAAEVLRFLIRSGGQKKAAWPEQLAKESGADAAQIRALLESLSNRESDSHGRPRNLLRTVGPLDKPMYEFVHDVMGLALRDWCERRRDQIAERKRHADVAKAEDEKRRDLDMFELQQKQALEEARLEKLKLENQRTRILAIGGSVAALALIGFVWLLVISNDRLNRKSSGLEVEQFGFEARSNMLLANRTKIRRQEALEYSIDALAESRRTRIKYESRENAEEPSADQLQSLMTSLLFYEQYNKPEVYMYNVTTGIRVENIGEQIKNLVKDRERLNLKEKSELLFAARLLSNESEITPGEIKERRDSKNNLRFSQVVWLAVNDQQNRNGAVSELRKWLKEMNISPEEAESIVNDRKNLERIRKQIRDLDKAAWNAQTLEKLKSLAEGYKPLSDELKELSWLRGLLELDGKSRVLKTLVEEADFRAQEQREAPTKAGDRGAIALYEKAIWLDPKILGTEKPKDRFERLSRPESDALASAKRSETAKIKIDEGNRHAEKKDRQRAINAYQEAIKLDPYLRDKLDPEVEYSRFSGDLNPNSN